MDGTQTPRSPGRPRSPEADDAIIQATLELLAEVGYQSLTMEQVRDRAGVGKATIYRRYENKQALVRAAVSALTYELPEPDDEGDLRSDWARGVGRAYESALETGAANVVPRILAEMSLEPELQQLYVENVIEPRRRYMRRFLERAIERGEMRADVDIELVMDMLVGSLVYRGMIGTHGMDPDVLRDRSKDVLETLIRGLRP
jgi:AcrR family transcriptional regulator